MERFEWNDFPHEKLFKSPLVKVGASFRCRLRRDNTVLKYVFSCYIFKYVSIQDKIGWLTSQCVTRIVRIWPIDRSFWMWKWTMLWTDMRIDCHQLMRMNNIRSHCVCTDNERRIYSLATIYSKFAQRNSVEEYIYLFAGKARTIYISHSFLPGVSSKQEKNETNNQYSCMCVFIFF